jgi:hypothetical protein
MKRSLVNECHEASLVFDCRKDCSLLMLFAKEVVDSLHRIEGAEGNLDEDCTPVAHGAIPQAR